MKSRTSAAGSLTAVISESSAGCSPKEQRSITRTDRAPFALSGLNEELPKEQPFVDACVMAAPLRNVARSLLLDTFERARDPLVASRRTGSAAIRFWSGGAVPTRQRAAGIAGTVATEAKT